MINKEFEVYKLKKQIVKCGQSLVFYREGENDYGEPDGTPTVLGTLSGIYHESNSHVSITVGETTAHRTEKVPYFLCILADVTALGIQPRDYTLIGEKKYEVQGTVDIQNWGLIGDISLEVVDVGKD